MQKPRVPFRFVPVDGADASASIVAQVRTAIESGALKVGDRLPSERALAELLQVSRNTVRVALISMSRLGIVHIRRGAKGGAYVSGGSGATIRDAMVDLFHIGSVKSEELTEARIILGEAVMRLACDRCTAADIATLQANVAAAELAIARSDIAGRMSTNIEFYHLLGVAAKNEVLTVVMDAIGAVILQFVRTAGLLPPAEVMPIRYEIIECLRARDAERGARALTRHLRRQHKTYLSKIDAIRTRDGATSKRRAAADVALDR